MISGAIALTVAEPAEHGEEAEAKKPFVASLAAPPGASADGFAETELTVASDVPIELEFDNQDNAVPHNFAIYTEEGGDPIFQGETITGPAKTTYTFTIPDPGQFYFHCDVHPQMNGTVIAGEGGGGGGSPGDEGGGQGGFVRGGAGELAERVGGGADDGLA